MILVDFHAVVFSNLHLIAKDSPGKAAGFIKSNPKDADIESDLSDLRGMVLNSLRRYRRLFSKDFGELVLCCDSNNSWRKEVRDAYRYRGFAYYKANRKKARDATGINWKQVFSSLEVILDELQANFPYKIIKVDRAEADDLVATICHNFGSKGLRMAKSEGIKIISRDKDFGQLQVYANVSQYDPITNKPVLINNPEEYLHEHIMRGDTVDGVPNFLSDDDTLVVKGKRSKSLRAEMVNTWMSMKPQDICADDDKLMANWDRNKRVISLEYNDIPEYIRVAVAKIWEQDLPVSDRSKLMTYFTKNRLRNLIPNMGEF